MSSFEIIQSRPKATSINKSAMFCDSWPWPCGPKINGLIVDVHGNTVTRQAYLLLSARPAVTFPASGRHRRWPVPIYTAWWTEAHCVWATWLVSLTAEWPGIESASSMSWRSKVAIIQRHVRHHVTRQKTTEIDMHGSTLNTDFATRFTNEKYKQQLQNPFSISV